jgi:hypothetical protein
MKLPNKFCFRVGNIPGFTHTIAKNAHGDYEVSWARGYPNKIRSVPRVVFEECEVQEMMHAGAWTVVDDRLKQEELPDEFYFSTIAGDDYKAIRHAGYYQVIWPGDDEGTTYTFRVAKDCVRDGTWKIKHKRTLTLEQQRRLNDFNERVQQLEQAIKLNEQSIEHYKRLVANCEATRQDLLKKIEEMV